MMHKPFRMLITAILSLVLLLLVPCIVIADGPADENAPVTPTIEVQKDGWLIISYSGKVADKAAVAQQLDAFLANALAEMVSSKQDIVATDGGGFGLRGYRCMEAAQEIPYGNSYVRGWFSTCGSWSGGGAYFYGCSSSAWFGTDPSYNCEGITLEHTLSLLYEEDIVAVPSGWFNYGSYCKSYEYAVEDTWYLGTAWSGVEVEYEYPGFIAQLTSTTFEFEDGRVWTNPSNIMRYGY